MAELIIMFREVLEASLIIGILYTYLKKSGNNSSIKMLWGGVLSAVIASIVSSFAFQIVAGGFEGNASKVFEGVVMIIASIVLTTMIIWMAKNKNISEDLKNRAEESLSSNFRYGIFTLAFVAVFREGVEIILFLYAVGVKDGISIMPSIAGSILGLLAGYAVFVQGVKIPIKKFFDVTSAFLILIAAGMLTYGVHELESGGVIPYVGGKVENDAYPMVGIRGNGEKKEFYKQYDKGEDFIDCDSSLGICDKDEGWDPETMGNGKWDIGEVYTDNIAISTKKVSKWASRIWDINPDIIKIKHGEVTSKQECIYKWKDDKCIEHKYPIMHDKGAIGGLLKGFFGYNGDPSLIEFITWVFSICGLLYLWRNSNRGQVK